MRFFRLFNQGAEQGMRGRQKDLGGREPAAAPTQTCFISDTSFKAVADSLGLSPREHQIVRCVFDDTKETAIASELGISVHTVHTYSRRLYRKLDISSRVGLVLRIVEEYLHLRYGEK